MFTSDNGYMMGEHRLGEKLVAYEESIRVPLIIRVPWDLTPHQESRMVANLDLAPTIAALAGATPTRIVDGRSLVPLLTGVATPFWRRLLLVENFEAGVDVPPGFPLPLPPEYFALRVSAASDGTPAPRLYASFTSAEQGTELYALDIDPYELANVEATRRSEIQQLAPVLNSMKTCTG